MNLLKDTTVYLAGPVEFDENHRSWRDEITEFLNKIGVKVYDPLVKPDCLYPPITQENPSGYLDNFRKWYNSDKPLELSNSLKIFNALKYVRKICLRLVRASDWTIFYLPKKFSVGTYEELTEAVRLDKPILVFCEDGQMYTSSWALSMIPNDVGETHEIFNENIEDLKLSISSIDEGRTKIDPLKWIFISYFKEGLNVKNVASLYHVTEIN